MTNLTTEEVPASAFESGAIKLAVGGKEIRKFAPTFALGTPGEPIAVIGSAGYLEIASTVEAPRAPSAQIAARKLRSTLADIFE